MEHKITIRKIEHMNHDVLRILTDKPKGYNFTPGQATDVALDKDGLRNEKRPFTFTNLPSDEELEFIIKVYPSHDGVTEQMDKLQVGDHLIIGAPWGAINYQGKGAFIAGGTGITPFVAIFKDLLQKDELSGNQLFFSNQTEEDIILKDNLATWLGDDVYLALSKEDKPSYYHGHIDLELLKKHNLDKTKPVYLCGPPPMSESVKTALYELGVSKDLIVEEG